MNCDFKVGDEVVCVHPGPWRSPFGRFWDFVQTIRNRVPLEGIQYTITGVFWGAQEAIVTLRELDAPAWRGRPTAWAARCFRKVHRTRRDISAWIAQPTDYEEPKVKRKEGV